MKNELLQQQCWGERTFLNQKIYLRVNNTNQLTVCAVEVSNTPHYLLSTSRYGCEFLLKSTSFILKMKHFSFAKLSGHFTIRLTLKNNV